MRKFEIYYEDHGNIRIVDIIECYDERIAQLIANKYEPYPKVREVFFNQSNKEDIDNNYNIY